MRPVSILVLLRSRLLDTAISHLKELTGWSLRRWNISVRVIPVLPQSESRRAIMSQGIGRPYVISYRPPARIITTAYPHGN